MTLYLRGFCSMFQRVFSFCTVKLGNVFINKDGTEIHLLLHFLKVLIFLMKFMFNFHVE